MSQQKFQLGNLARESNILGRRPPDGPSLQSLPYGEDCNRGGRHSASTKGKPPLRSTKNALKMEMFEASNDLANRATLLELRSETHEKKGEWEDALRTFDEACRLKDQAAEQQGTKFDEGSKEVLERKLRRGFLLGMIMGFKTRRYDTGYVLWRVTCSLIGWGIARLLIWIWSSYGNS
jgi:hypothetical protein